MEISQKKSFNSRKFVSIGLFFALAGLVITGTLIQTFEALGDLTFELALHACTAIHVLTGIVFAIFSIFHIITNWRALKSHIKKAKNAAISKEAIVAFFVVVVLVVAGIILATYLF